MLKSIAYEKLFLGMKSASEYGEECNQKHADFQTAEPVFDTQCIMHNSANHNDFTLNKAQITTASCLTKI